MQIIRFSRSQCTFGKLIRSNEGEDDIDQVEGDDDDDDDVEAGERGSFSDS